MGLWNAVFPRPEPKPAPAKELPKEVLAIGTIVGWQYEQGLDLSGTLQLKTSVITVKVDQGTGFITVPVNAEQFTEIQKLTTTEGVVKIAVSILPEEFW